MNKNSRKLFLIITMLLILVTLTATSYADDVILSDGSTLASHSIYSLIKINKSGYVYDSDLKTRLFKVSKGDTAIEEVNELIFKKKGWTKINIDKWKSGYIKTNIVFAKKGKIERKGFFAESAGLYCFDKSFYLYDDINSKEISGVLRKRVVFNYADNNPQEVIRDGKKMYAKRILTFDGVKYVVVDDLDMISVVMEEIY